MKRIVFMIQQTQRFGGTEMVSYNILKGLKEKYNYDTLLISNAVKADCSFLDLDNVNITYLNIPMNVVRFDEFLSSYISNHRYIKAIKLIINLIYYFVFKRNYYRSMIQNITNKDDIIIASSLDTYLFAPKDRQVIFHFHFDSKDYLKNTFKFMLKFCIKPIYTVFLTNSTRDEVIKKELGLADKSITIYNASRYKSEKISKHSRLNLIFVGRLENQKNPELLIEVMKVLKDRNFDFHLDICGDGSKYNKINHMIDDYNLNDCISMHGMVKNIDDFYRKSDGQIVTSITEGYALSIIEANSFSLYSISTRCGDSIYEVIKDGINGVVVDSFDPSIIADTIILEFSNNLEKKKISAYEYSINYQTDNILDKWHKLIESI